jgi:hypothetical protein
MIELSKCGKAVTTVNLIDLTLSSRHGENFVHRLSIFLLLILLINCKIGLEGFK